MEKDIKKELKKFRKRVMFLLLYPDDPTHLEALDIIQNPSEGYKYAMILHDADRWDTEDEKKNPVHKSGELKKSHYHVVLQFSSAVWNTSICKTLGIDLNYCMETDFHIDKLLLYLLHYENNDKTPYNIENVEGPLKVRLEELLNKYEKTEGEKVLEITNYIKTKKGHLSYIELVEWAASSGYWAELRRGGSLFIKCVDEKNFYNMPTTSKNKNEIINEDIIDE